MSFWAGDWEGDIPRTVEKSKKRADGRLRRARLKALGNGVVNQCARVAGEVLRDVLAGVIVPE